MQSFNNQIFCTILLFFVCILTFTEANSQNLHLTIQLTDSSEIKTHNLKIPYNLEHANLKSVHNEIETFKTNLTHEGFFNHTVDSFHQHDKNYTYYINPRKKVDSIVITNNIPSLKNHPKTIHIKPKELTSTLNNLTKTLDQLNSPFSQISLTNLHIKNRTLSATLKLTEAQKRTLDSITIREYTNFPKNFLKHYAKLKTGIPFSKQQLEEKANLLNNLSFTSLQKPPEVLFSKDSTTLYLYLTKTNSNYFDGYIGFNTDEETNKLKFNGTVNLQLNNNLNYGEEINIYWKNNGEEQSTFNLTGKAPYLFNTPISITTNLSIIRQDSTYANTFLKLSPSYTINSKHSLGLTYQNNTSTGTRSAEINNIEDYTTTLYGITYNFTDNQNQHPFLQTKGFNTTIATGTRTLDNNQTPQTTIEFEGFYQFNITQNSKIYTKNTTRSLFSNNYLINEQYLFGGINSIRGFEENSLSGNFYTITNIEFRNMLTKKLYLHSITDFCYYEDTNNSLKNNLFSLGVGIGIINKSSIFKLNYAVGLTNETAEKLNNSKIHLSYSTFF
ncbi:BamA/TamA family outer membrane protein [Neptunitalea lumnitzerae]|uniref:Membrane protein n=1 Tax=Neptunitalea lumnitzerae TaxID=2965509 RepID=A0ABQ5MHE1_9FLAO|nr:hypothetical protein [Neptunitalea sp. Y10]GLB48826.1 membrane protein [Neptunitalea sp. Y10]